LAILGVLLFLNGLIPGDIFMIVIGSSLALEGTSLYLTSYVKIESKAKKILEVITLASGLGIIVCGYFLTGNLLLEFLTLFIITFFIVAFLSSYFIPKICRNR